MSSSYMLGVTVGVIDQNYSKFAAIKIKEKFREALV